MKILSLLLLIPTFALAQNPWSEQGPKNTLRQEGQLVTVQLVLGEPLRIFVVGREEAKVDLSDLQVTVRRLKPYRGKILSADKFNNYFVVSEPELKDSTDIEVTTKIKTKTETLRFKIENKLN